jgi:nitroreductase
MGTTGDRARSRKCRQCRPEPVPGADLERIVEAAWRAPPARNNQHWDFVVVTDKARLEGLSTAWLGAAHIESAPAAIALVVPVPGDARISTVSGIEPPSPATLTRASKGSNQ